MDFVGIIGIATLGWGVWMLIDWIIWQDGFDVFDKDDKNVNDNS